VSSVDNSIAEIEKSIEQLRKSLEDTFKFKTKLELNKSDLLHFMKMAEQNMKYLKKRNTIVIVSEYQKVVKSHASAVRQIEDLEQQICAIEQAIDKLTKSLAEQVELLEALKKAAEPKVLQFNRRS
jgi:DNA-binding helix-hairpin-helix protein with protein kinase domain